MRRTAAQRSVAEPLARHERLSVQRLQTQPHRLLRTFADDAHRHRKLLTAIVVTLTTVGVLLFLAQDTGTLQIRSALGVADPRFPGYLATQINAPITRGNRFTVLQNGDQIFLPMLEAIGQARRRVEFESYIFSGSIADKFAAALIAAAQRGVQVRVVLDAFGVAVSPARLRERLEQSGARLVWFNGLSTWTIDKANFRTHRKLLVVDGSVAFTGGAGVADKWMGNAEDQQHWRDTQFRVTGPAAAALEAAFFENWTEAGGDPAPFFDPPDGSVGDPSPSITVWSNASEGTNDVKLMVLFAIAAAQRTIDIQSPYFLPDASLRRVLSEARQRGVRIRVLTDGDITDTQSVKSASRAQYSALLATGDQLFEYQPTMMHAKVMVVDGLLSIVGTANFDNRSFELNDEVAIAAFDPALAETLTGSFDGDLTRSTQITADTWRQRSLFARVAEMFWSPFSEIF